MKKQTLFLILLVLSPVWSVLAILPPDAEYREPEIRAYRQQVRKDYEQKLEARRKVAVQEYHRVKIALDIPPWKREEIMKAKDPVRIDPSVLEPVRLVEETGKNRLWVSIILLLLIGSVVAWVKRATREVDE